MARLKRFEILIDNPEGVFCPGEVVSAHVIVEPVEKLKLREIRAKFSGFADVHWKETYTDNKGTHQVDYRNHETYFDKKVIVLGEERGFLDTVILQPGSYVYSVSFTLPADIPSSYEALYGQVRYQIKVTIVRPWALNDEHTRTYFTVANLLDLNKEPKLMNEVSVTDQKVLCCFCCASDPIIATVNLPRTGYVPGEIINFNAEIENRSTRAMNHSWVKFIMQVKYHTFRKTRTINNILFYKRKGKIDGGGKEVWRDEKMLIPPVPPSYLLGCKIIDIKYLVMIRVVPRGTAFDLEVPVEVVIGNIPFDSVAEQYGVNVQVFPPRPGFPNELPQFSPSTYAESVFGMVDTREEDDGEDTAGNTSYVPVYSYYNRNKQDPAELFAVQTDED